jgi:nitrilase
MKVAAVQGSPVFMDKQATTMKMLNYMEKAASNGASLCVFPEAFLPGYPWWIYLSDFTEWDSPKFKEVYAIYLENSVSTDGPEIAQIADKARKLNMMTIFGIMEKSASHGTVYCTLVTIHPKNGIINIHRKLNPTFAEKMVWGTGDGHGLNVYEWDGFKIGGLSCWENWMPLARFSLYAQGEQLHIATFPGLIELTADITKFVAMESRSYVVTVGGLLEGDDIDDGFPLKNEMLGIREVLLNGGTYIVGPDGEDIVPMQEPKETIVYAKLSLQKVLEERQNFDPAGHYNRHDVLSLNINKIRLEPISKKEEA